MAKSGFNHGLAKTMNERCKGCGEFLNHDPRIFDDSGNAYCTSCDQPEPDDSEDDIDDDLFF